MNIPKAGPVLHGQDGNLVQGRELCQASAAGIPEAGRPSLSALALAVLLGTAWKREGGWANEIDLNLGALAHRKGSQSAWT